MLTDTVNCQVVIARLAYVYQSGLYELLHTANISFTHLGNESLWTVVGMVPHEGSLPPLVIVAIQDVEGITVFEGEACRGVDVFNGVVVKESFVCVCVWVGMCVWGGVSMCVCVDGSGRHIIYSTWTCSRKSLIRTRDERDERCSDS